MPSASHYRALAVIAIHNERRRQVDVEGWTPEHDDEHSNGGLRLAANAYLRFAEGKIPDGEVPEHWPWEPQWWKPATVESSLIKSGALSLAEDDRLSRGPFFLNRDLAIRATGELRQRAIRLLAIIYRARDEAHA